MSFVGPAKPPATSGLEAFAAVAAELRPRSDNGVAANGAGEQDAVDALLPDEPVA